MKKVILTFLSFAALSSGVLLKAQDTSKYGPNAKECQQYIQYYEDYYKSKNYDDATPNWRKAYSICPPSSRQSLMIQGSSLVERLIAKNSKNPIVVEGLVDTLLTLQDQRAEFFPNYKVNAMNNKASYAAKYIKSDPARVYEIYEGVIAAIGGDTKASVIFNDFKAAVDLYGAGALETETVLNLYTRNMSMLDGIQPASDFEKSQLADFRTKIENLFISSKVASCEDLIALFGPRYEAAPDDLALAKNIVKMLSLAEDCSDNDLFLNAVTTMYTQEPSAEAAYYLYKLHGAKGNVPVAIKYLNEAIDNYEIDDKKSASYLYELAVYCFKNGRSGSAYEAVNKVPAKDADMAGKAYLLLGTIWASTNCGSAEDLDSRAKYWVAYDYMVRAKNADSSLAADADRNMAQYSRYFPTKSDVFMYNVVKGESYTVACSGMRASTTVKTCD